MNVYRVQAQDGRGPWRPGFSTRWIEDDAPVGRLSETIMDLVSVRVLRALPPEMHWGCACRSMNELMAWFTPVERQRLYALGFYPVRLRADRIFAEGQYQLLIGRARPFSDGATRLRWPESATTVDAVDPVGEKVTG